MVLNRVTRGRLVGNIIAKTIIDQPATNSTRTDASFEVTSVKDLGSKYRP